MKTGAAENRHSIHSEKRFSLRREKRLSMSSIHGSEEKVNDDSIIMALKERMNVRERDKPEIFELIR